MLPDGDLRLANKTDPPAGQAGRGVGDVGVAGQSPTVYPGVCPNWVQVNLPAVGYNFSDQGPVGRVAVRFGAPGVQLTLRVLTGNRAEDRCRVEVSWS